MNNGIVATSAVFIESPTPRISGITNRLSIVAQGLNADTSERLGPRNDLSSMPP
jgi:hypothetical protein